MIYGDFTKIEQERMSIHIQEDETPNEHEGHLHRWCSKFEIPEVMLKVLYLKDILDSIIGFRNLI